MFIFNSTRLSPGYFEANKLKKINRYILRVSRILLAAGPGVECDVVVFIRFASPKSVFCIKDVFPKVHRRLWKRICSCVSCLYRDRRRRKGGALQLLGEDGLGEVFSDR